MATLSRHDAPVDTPAFTATMLQAYRDSPWQQRLDLLVPRSFFRSVLHGLRGHVPLPAETSHNSL